MNNISVGDLVRIYKPSPCCGDSRMIGIHFIVSKMNPSISKCIFCGVALNTIAVYGYSAGGVRIEILKKVPPISELDDIKTNEEITA